jgi:dolichol kinase
MNTQNLKKEFLRKSIHLAGIGYIPLYLFTGRDYTLAVVVSLTLFAALVELLKLKYGILPRWILRNHEINGIGSHLYTGVSVSIITMALPMEACFVAIANGILGDGVSGLMKRCKPELAPILMFATSFLFLIFLSIWIEMNFYALTIACIAGVFAENFPRIRGHYINDNFSVPLVSSISYKLFGY